MKLSSERLHQTRLAQAMCYLYSSRNIQRQSSLGRLPRNCPDQILNAKGKQNIEPKEERTSTIVVRVLAVPVSAFVAAAGTVGQSMARMVTDWVRAVAMNIVVATACATRMMMVRVLVISVNAFVATAGTIFQCMARMMRDRVVSCSHDICPTIDETWWNFVYL